MDSFSKKSFLVVYGITALLLVSIDLFNNNKKTVVFQNHYLMYNEIIEKPREVALQIMETPIVEEIVTEEIVTEEIVIEENVEVANVVNEVVEIKEEKPLMEERIEEIPAPIVETPVVEEVYVADVNFELAEQVVNFALQFIGNPYVYGGSSLYNGADCSGFVMSVYQNFGINLPRTSRDQANVGSRVSLDNIQVGDLIFYGYNGYISHAAIYIGNGQIVHAMNASNGITISNYLFMPVITVKRVL